MSGDGERRRPPWRVLLDPEPMRTPSLFVRRAHIAASLLAALWALSVASSAGAQPVQPQPGEPDKPVTEPTAPEGQGGAAATEPATPPTGPGPEEAAPKPPEKPKPVPAAPPAKPAPSTVAAAGAETGAEGSAEEAELEIQRQARLALGPVTLAPIVLVALQIVPYAGADSLVQAGDAAERGGFRLRHARLGLAGAYADQAEWEVSSEIAADHESASVRIRDAWAGYTPFQALKLYAGARTVPFSRSVLVGSGHGALIERPLAVRAMAPDNQVGAEVEGDFADGAFGYAAGVYNGFQRSDEFYGGYIENYSPIGNRFDGLAYAARLTSEPLGRLGATMADEHHDPFRFGVGASYFFSDGGTRDVHSAGGDALMHVYGFHLLAEVLWALNVPEAEPTQPTVETEQVTSFGFVAEAGYMILQDALGLAARFEWIDPNGNVEDEGDDWLLTVGAGYQFFDRLLKVQADYTHREEMAGLALANDSVMLQLQLQLEGPVHEPPPAEPTEPPAAPGAATQPAATKGAGEEAP